MAEGQSAAAPVLVDGAARPGVEAALFEAMLAGWRRQQQARRLSAEFVGRRERVVRRFAVFTGGWPWCWTPGQLERWVAAGGWAHSTVRLYQGSLACFLEYACDPRYGWAAECEARVGARPVQVCHEGNTAVHVAEYEGRPERRPLSRGELQALFDAADERVGAAARSRRKGWLTAFRDATLFKVVYGRGLRRAAAAMLWAAGALEQYLAEVRPRYGAAGVAALWLTERGERISARSVDDRFALARTAAGRAERALLAALICVAPDRGWRGPAVRPAAGGPLMGIHDCGIHHGRG